MSAFSNRTWEARLLDRAQEALRTPQALPDVPSDPLTLGAAYRYCAEITRLHSRTFHLASGLLPASKRRAARALYAFCRVSDDLVDNARAISGPPRVNLDRWRERVLSPSIPTDSPVATAWADTRHRYRIPLRYAEQLIEGVAHDLQKSRYASFDELAEYCYGVASTVGLMVMHIVGFRGREAIPYAVKLGVALQLTNILRDVGEDWRRGRLYLPADELESFGLSEADIANGRVDERWRAFMRFQIARNRKLYREARPGIARLEGDGQFAIAAAAELYAGILDAIEKLEYDVFHQRAFMRRSAKLRRLPGLWLQTLATRILV